MIWHFTAYTINCVCHSIRSMFRVLGIYNIGARGSWLTVEQLTQSSKASKDWCKRFSFFLFFPSYFGSYFSLWVFFSLSARKKNLCKAREKRSWGSLQSFGPNGLWFFASYIFKWVFVFVGSLLVDMLKESILI